MWDFDSSATRSGRVRKLWAVFRMFLFCSQSPTRLRHGSINTQPCRRPPACPELPSAPAGGDRRLRTTTPPDCSASSSITSGGAAAARSPTPPAATSRWRASPSTTAGARSTNCRRSRPRCTVDATRKIITRNESPDIGFDRSINPYRGCEHGCVYCFARPTHAYLGLSPGLDFESKLFVKPEAAELLEKELAAPNYSAEGDRHRHQHRSLSADRAPLPGHAPHPRSARPRRPSGRHRHQVGAGAARPRHSRAHGRAQSGQGRAVGDHARPRARAQDGAARGDADAAAGNVARGCRRPACRPR